MTGTVHGSATAFYALSLALDAAEPDADVAPLIAQGQAWAAFVESIPAGLATAQWRDAAAAFMRAWARHVEPDKAADLIRGAEDLELARDMHIATHVPEAGDA